MITAKHSPGYVTFFNWYSRFMIHKEFRRVNIIGDVKPDSRSILLIGNHFSWWDGFFATYLNYRMFHKKLHVMMLEEELEKRLFLNKAGAFSVKKGGRSVIESLNYASEILKDPVNLLIMYPHGEIASQHNRSVQFEKGIGKILKGLHITNSSPRLGGGREGGSGLHGIEDVVQIVFYIALIDYFSHRKPGLNIYLEELKFDGLIAVADIEKEFNAFHESSVLAQKPF
jgi:1-acyl-sn-glycerol-3-phosphate acyltransferase